MSVPAEKVEIEAEPGVTLSVLDWAPNSCSNDPSEAKSPLILLHGGGANSHWWDHIAARLAQTHRVLAFDFRGHGDSSYPSEYRVGAFGNDLEAILRWLDREDVILIGHSLGAAVALSHASRFSKTRGLVLVDLVRRAGKTPTRRARLALSFRRTYRSRQEAIDRFQFFPESDRAAEPLRAHIARHSVKEEGDGRFGYKFDPSWFSIPSNPRPDLAQVECPTLLIRGSESALLSRESATDLVASISQGTWTEIEASGHHVLIDQPSALLAQLRIFLGTLGVKT